MICLVGYYGGFRSCELLSLTFDKVEMDEMGYWITFTRSKQRSIAECSTICVPRRQSDWSCVSKDASRRATDFDPASVLDLYFQKLMFDFQCQKEDLKGCLFKGCHGVNGKRFTCVNVGKNTLGGVGVEIATELCLPNPETYTGHCWRRSAGTNASNAGVNVTTLMSMMGWSCPKTAMEYVKHSRMTSLQMSMYLANVQRQNVADPFPSVVSRSRRTVFRNSNSKKSGVECEKEPLCEKELTDGGVSEVVASVGVGEIDESGVHVNEVESINGGGEGVRSFESVPSVVPASSESIVNLNNVDSRLGTFFPNLSNHGNLNIHFHFGDKK